MTEMYKNNTEKLIPTIFRQYHLLYEKNNCLNSTNISRISNLSTSRPKKYYCYYYFLTLILLISPKEITQDLKNHLSNISKNKW